MGPLHRTRPAGAPLLALAQTDPGKFVAFYDAYCDQVVRFFMRRTFDAGLSLDLTSETFAIALEKCRRFRGSTVEEEQGWLFAIARSQLSGYWKKGKAEWGAMKRMQIVVPLLHEDDIEYMERAADLDELRPALRAALVRLPDDQRLAVHLRVVDELGYSEIATRLAVTEQVVRARVSRGLRALAALIDQPDARETSA